MGKEFSTRRDLRERAVAEMAYDREPEEPGAKPKVPPVATPDDEPDVVDRTSKIAARAQRSPLGAREGMTPEERLARTKERRRQLRSRAEERTKRISDDLAHYTDTELAERQQLKGDRREEHQDKERLTRILRDTRVHDRIEAAAQRRAQRWAQKAGIEPEPAGGCGKKARSR